VAVLAALAGLGWGVSASPWLSVRSVTVSGTHRLTPDEVRARAQVNPGDALLWVSPDDVARRVRLLPGVATVRVERRWPSELQVTVVETRTVARLEPSPGTPPQLVDETGATVPVGRAEHVERLPVVRDVPGMDRQRLAAAATVLTALPAPLAGDVLAVRVPTGESVTLRLRDGASVVWGGPGQSSQKARVLAALVAQHPSRHYDVSAPQTPTTRP
jgi:cell division protein FtsQ